MFRIFQAPLVFQVRGPEILGVSLRTNGEAVGTGVLCGSNAVAGIIRQGVGPSKRSRWGRDQRVTWGGLRAV